MAPVETYSLAEIDADDAEREEDAVVLSLSAVSKSTCSAVDAFVFKHKFDSDVEKRLRDLPERYQIEAASTDLSARVKNPSAYMSKIIRGMLQQPHTWAEAESYDRGREDEDGSRTWAENDWLDGVWQHSDRQAQTSNQVVGGLWLQEQQHINWEQQPQQQDSNWEHEHKQDDGNWEQQQQHDSSWEQKQQQQQQDSKWDQKQQDDGSWEKQQQLKFTRSCMVLCICHYLSLSKSGDMFTKMVTKTLTNMFTKTFE